MKNTYPTGTVRLIPALSKPRGFILASIIVFLLFILFMVLGSFRLGITSQNYVTKAGDFERAKILAHEAIFDQQSGAIATLRQIESYTGWTGSSCSGVIPASMAESEIAECMANYFTDGCNNAASSNFPKGLCSASAVGVAVSPSVLRIMALSSGNYQPCQSYTLSNVVNSIAAIPLIDINDAATNGHSRYATEYNRGETGLCALPRYQIELLSHAYKLSTAAENSYVQGARIYRVTSRAFGKNGNTQVTEQAYFMAQCNNQKVCSLSLLSDQVLH